MFSRRTWRGTRYLIALWAAQRFGSSFLDEEFDTIGGMVTAEFGHLPEAGEEISLGGFDFHVSKADDRRVHQFTVRVHAN